MSRRSSIKQAMIELVKSEMDGNQKPLNPRIMPPYAPDLPLFDIYKTNIYNSVSGDNLYVQDVPDWPYISVALGPEAIEYQPGGFRWIFLTLYIRVYVRSEDETEERLEELIEDVKTFIDRNEDLSYTVTKPDGTSETLEATQMTIQEITTDEGVLKPEGIGEIRVSVRYQDRNSRFTR